MFSSFSRRIFLHDFVAVHVLSHSISACIVLAQKCLSSWNFLICVSPLLSMFTKLCFIFPTITCTLLFFLFAVLLFHCFSCTACLLVYMVAIETRRFSQRSNSEKAFWERSRKRSSLGGSAHPKAWGQPHTQDCKGEGLL